MKTVRRRIARAMDIEQEYELHSTPQAAARAVNWKDATIIAIHALAADRELLGYDAVPRGQPLPERSYIVGHKVMGRYRHSRDEMDEYRAVMGQSRAWRGRR